MEKSVALVAVKGMHGVHCQRHCNFSNHHHRVAHSLESVATARNGNVNTK